MSNDELRAAMAAWVGGLPSGATRGGLVALGLPVDALPRAEAPMGSQVGLWA